MRQRVITMPGMVSTAFGAMAKRGWLIFFMLFAVSANAQMAGTYTICNSGCDYSSFNSAVSDLITKGVNGAVTFKVSAGIYTEQVSIPVITGSSSTNTITFDGQDSSKTTLTYSYTGSVSASSYTVELKGADYFTIKNMTIIAGGTTYGLGVHFTGTADHNTVQSCVIKANPSATSTTNIPVAITGSSYTTTGNHGNYNLIDNCLIDGGYMNVALYGTSSTTHCFGNQVTNSTLTNAYNYGIYSYYQRDNSYLGNKITLRTGTSLSYGIYTVYNNSTHIERNNIVSYYMGIYMSSANNVTTTTPFLVANNMVKVNYTSCYGLYMSSAYSVKAYHNTVYHMGTSAYCVYVTGGSNNEVRNNILYKTGTGTSYCLYVSSASYVSSSDYNDFISAGGSFVYFGSAYADLPALIKGTNTNKNSTTAIPPFVSLTAGSEDLHLKPTAPAPYGTYVGVDVDIDGDVRCKTFPTVGADEDPYGKSASLVKFYAPTKVYVNSPVAIANSASLGEPKIHAWFVDGTKVSDSVTLYYSFPGPSHKVKLVTTSCTGKDSFEQTITVSTPTNVPSTNFLASRNVITQGQAVKLFDMSTNGPTSWKWDISPDSTYDQGLKVSRYTYLYGSDTSAKNEVRFDYPGKYKVCLFTGNSIGNGSNVCKVDYIKVQAAYNLGQLSVIADSAGTLYDDGGPNGNYSPNLNNKGILIAPCASEVYLVINKMDLECSYETVRIYDGPDRLTGTRLDPCPNGFSGGPSSKTCASYCAPNLNGTDTFVAKSGMMYIEMSSDASLQLSGFEMVWWSKPKVVKKPAAKFNVPDSICINTPVTFTNQTTGDNVQYMWDLDNDLSTMESTASGNPVWYYSSNGKVPITLIASNCGGTDTFIKEIAVYTPNQPKVSFSADNTTPTTNDVVYFTSLIPQCVDNFRWTFTKKYAGNGNITYINKTSSKSQNPAVIFPDTGCYNVMLYADNLGGKDSLATSCYITVRNPYCIPAVTTLVQDIGISEVILNTIDNTSDQGANQYSNFTPTVSTRLEIGQSYTLTVKRSTNNNNISRAAWIDWNGDGDFSDKGELIGADTNKRTSTWSVNFTPPTAARQGATVLRIAVNATDFENKPCGANEFGEYEDYRVYIETDKTPPVITLTGSDTVAIEQGYTYIDSGAIANDNLDGNITFKISVDKGGFNNMVAGTYIFRYDVNDAAGNKAEEVKRVVIVTPDKTAPDLQVELPDTVFVDVMGTYTPPAILSANDLVDGPLDQYVLIGGDNVDANVVDTYKVVYSVSDKTGNKATVTRIIIVRDNVLPVLKLNGNATEFTEVGTTYTDSGYTVTDNYYSNAIMSALVKSISNVDVSKLGTYTVTYTVTDPSGNGPVSVTRTVIVRDTQKPVLTINGNPSIKLEVFSQFSDPGIIVSDNYDQITGWDTLGTFYQNFPTGFVNRLGNYTIIYSVTDQSGNVATLTRNIQVVDDIAPVISIKGEPNANICRWKAYTDAGYDVSDNYSPVSGITVTKEGSFVSSGTLKEGVYNLRYKAVDSVGNISYSQWRTILVQSPEQCQSTGISSESKLSSYLSVYPNPTDGKFVLKASLPIEEKDVIITLTNLLGKEISRGSGIDLFNNSLSFDISSQASGIYFLNVTTLNSSWTQKIILSK